MLFFRAKDVVESVYSIEIAARDNFIRESCLFDEALKREVRTILLALHGPEDQFLEPEELGIGRTS